MYNVVIIMRRFFYIFLILNLVMSASVFANDINKGILILNTKKIYDFITTMINNGHDFDNVLRELVIQKAESIVGVRNFDGQYKLLRAAMKNTDRFESTHTVIYEHSDEVFELLNDASQEIKEEHPNQIVPDRTVVFSNVSTIIDENEINEVSNKGSECSVFASSMIEGDAAKPKQNGGNYEELKDAYERLKAQNNTLAENFKKERSEFMDKQVELSAENGGLKAENNGLKERVVSLERQVQDLERLKSLNELYEQVVEIYQKITKSKLDFKQIIELMKQIRGKKGEK